MMRDEVFFFWGASAMACLVAMLFFLRFWRQSHDRLFVWFAAAFGALALNWMGLALTRPTDEARTWFFLMRFAAFLAILYAIWEKNRGDRRGGSSG